MKKSFVLLSCFLTILIAGCATTGKTVGGVKSVKPPEIVDYEGRKFNEPIPEWVKKGQEEIRKLSEYKDVYVFKLAELKAKNVEGAKMVIRNVDAAGEIAKTINLAIEDTTDSGNIAYTADRGVNTVETVKTVSKAGVGGFRKESEYWILQRYFTPDGEVEGDFYDVYMLFTIPKKQLDKIIEDAFAKVPATSQADIDARALVMEKLRERFSN